jgi:hypothetical protein
MKTFSQIAIATLTMVGVASAQPKAPEKAPAPPAKAAPKADPKGAPAMPAVPPEIEAMGKTAAGTWKCKGDDFDPMSGAKSPLTATNTVKLDLDKWWIVENMEVKGKMTFKMVAYTTYDATSKKWRRLSMMNDGGHMIGTSDGMKDNKMTWNMDMITPMGAGMFRDSMDLTDAKAGMKSWGEMSMDKGKTWKKVYEMTCKK